MRLVKHHKSKVGPLAPTGGFGPFWPMQRLDREMERWFREPFGRWLAGEEPLRGAWLPAVDVREKKDCVVVKAELPGMKKEEFEVYMSGENLNITGERKAETEEEAAELYRAERYFGRFHRSIPRPSPVDAGIIDAHDKVGILTITCPKAA